MYIAFRLDEGVNLYVVEQEFVNPFCNLEKTTTIESIESTLESLKQYNICAIINCIDNDQSMKAYGIYYLNIHINFQDSLEASRLFLHVKMFSKKSFGQKLKNLQLLFTVKAACKRHLYNWDEERVQKEIQEQNKLNQTISKDDVLLPTEIIQSQKSSICNELVSDVNTKSQIDWNKIYGSQAQIDQQTQQAKKVQSRFVQSSILKNQ
ncbi:unnamed protein product (macronuclear) [Paramecium tetraurelia]|uniref:Uncharacterized protein n=1 Tax=Paramecium tetraurelia TaxID=5888 RepID=A0E8X1_PARTE|nr:uncharacterized protein GSPATT00024469001 [Paramecium tetraurelia]CAK91738.1 unnamed protein product [Paramecium tetraurelia]|eukprot:XP_001459135.1 hypothetical protein (macronuclear) [Paramecium tetraurelia strain d4-2]